jgi:hypothetical protein
MTSIVISEYRVDNNRKTDNPLFHIYSIVLTDTQREMISPPMTTTFLCTSIQRVKKDTRTLRAAFTVDFANGMLNADFMGE